MQQIQVQVVDGNTILVGNAPRLVIDLAGGAHYIEDSGERIPYKREIQISPDLLRGERGNVLQTAMEFYYSQACDVVSSYKKLADYKKKLEAK